MKKIKNIKVLLITLAMALVFVLSSCGAGDNEETNYGTETSGIYVVTDGERKQIVSYNYDFETEDITVLMNKVKAKVTEVGGYAQSQKLRSDYARCVYKIPKDNVETFENYLDVDLAEELANKELDTEDVTDDYTDLTSLIETYEKRIAEYEEKKETASAEDVIIYNDKIDELTAKVESYKKQKQIIENSTKYGTFEIEFEEVTEPRSFSDKAVDKLKYVGTRLLVILPFSFAAAGIYLVGLYVNKKKRDSQGNDNNNNNDGNNTTN